MKKLIVNKKYDGKKLNKFLLENIPNLTYGLFCNTLRKKNIKVIVDIVLNHKMGADETEEVFAIQDDINDRNIDISNPIKIKAWTKYNFPGRGDTYSSFKWNWTHFHGVDWDENTQTSGIFKFYGKMYTK